METKIKLHNYRNEIKELINTLYHTNTACNHCIFKIIIQMGVCMFLFQFLIFFFFVQVKSQIIYNNTTNGFLRCIALQ